MNNIIITGSSGLVATQLIMLLLKKDGIHLHLLTGNVQKLCDRYSNYKDKISVYDLESFMFFCESHHDVSFQCLVHTAFARSSEGDLLAQSLKYCEKILYIAKTINLKAYVNISSQSVYGQKTKPLWDENTQVAPNYMYALGKYATELLTNAYFENTKINYTNIRLSSVCENARFMNIFVQNSINGQPIKIIGGKQTCSFIDVRDVATALSIIIDKSGEESFQTVYNLGTNSIFSISQIANIIKEISKEYGKNVEIIKEEKDIRQDVGMDSSLFMHSFNWKPAFDMKAMIRSLFEYNLNLQNSIRGGNC